MKYFILFLSVTISSLAFAQRVPDTRALQAQRASGFPFSIPFTVSSDGELGFFSKNAAANFTYQPAIQIGFNRTIIEYSHPVIANKFDFSPIIENIGWIEIRNQKWKLGLGLVTLMKATSFVGILPYRGAGLIITSHKADKNDRSLPFAMPSDLKELEDWHIHDTGTFQTYGGIQTYLGAGVGGVKLGIVGLGIQNQFVVEMKKTAPDEVLLKISEENLKNRKLRVGPFLAAANLEQMRGKRFVAEFKLNVRDPKHHDYFKEALKGNLTLLEENLKKTSHTISWKGWDAHFYIGIPAVVSKTHSREHYELNEDEVGSVLDISGSLFMGPANRLRNNQNYAYQTEDNIVVIWTSEMTKVNKKVLEKNFLSKGRTLGVKGFDRDFNIEAKLGSVVTQVGVNVSRKEVEGLKKGNIELVKTKYMERCVKENLPCQKEKVALVTINKMVEILKKPWVELRGDLGLLLLREPALVHAVLKSMKYKKQAYIKFLSQKYQSLEGSAPIEI